MTCLITGSVFIPDGSSASNRQITIRKEDFTLSAQGTLTILPEELTVYTDASGNVSFSLVAGTYSGYYVSHPEGRIPFRLKVPSGTATANFADLIVVTSVTEDPALTQLILDAYEAIENGGSGGGPAVWGAITGTLNDQVDLKTALDAKASNVALAAKADTSTVNAALILKANVTDVLDGLATKADVSHTHTFASLTDKPTDVSGYGITDAVTLHSTQTITGKKHFTETVTLVGRNSDPSSHVEGEVWYNTTDDHIKANIGGSVLELDSPLWSRVASKPTTVSGFGITDAALKSELVGENFIRNPRFRDWVNTTAVVSSTTPIEAAADWFGDISTGSLTITRVIDSTGLNGDPAIRVSNIGTPGTFQALIQTIEDYQSLLDTNLRLSFDARTSTPGRVWNNINMGLVYDGTLIYKQAVPGASASIQLNAEWTRHSATVTPFNLTPAQITEVAAATNVSIRLEFQINAGTAARELWFDLRNVKLERGSVETRLLPIQRNSVLWSDLAGTPTDLVGYGITDAVRTPWLAATSGEWTTTGAQSNASAMFASNFMMGLYVVPYDMTITEVGLHVATAGAAGVTAKVTIYDSHPTDRPRNRLLESPDINVSATGPRTVALLAPITLRRGQVVWFGARSSGSVTITTTLGGHDSRMQVMTTPNTVVKNNVTRSTAYANPTQSPWVWSTSEIGVGGNPFVFMRLQ